MRLPAVAALLLGVVPPAHAQERAYVGGAIGVVGDMQTPSVSRVGGKTWSGTVYGGAHVSPRLSIELEGAFGGTVPGQTYVYRPSPSLVAEVDQHGRHTFITTLLRATLGRVEPVAGVSWVRSTFSRHAVFVPGSQTYFDDQRSQHRFGMTCGVDGVIDVSRRVAVVPSLRVFLTGRGAQPVGGNYLTGSSFAVRAGIGARMRF